MLESYQQEVIRKRKSARIFWFLVFSFTIFLYFFFQGFYPDVRVGLRQIFRNSEQDLSGSGNELIKSFGIINISVKNPVDATILVSSGAFSSNEKRIVKYGNYQANITRENYIQDTFEFSIDKEMPYYISSINLLPRPRYTKYGTGFESFTRINDSTYIAKKGTGTLVLDATFSGSHTMTDSYRSIGEGYFLSGKTLVTYNGEDHSWEKKIWNGSVDYITQCKNTISIRYGYMLCGNDNTLLTEGGKTLSGITQIEKGYLRKGEKILIGETMSPVTLSGSEKNSPFFIEHDAIWYGTSSGKLIPLSSYYKGKKSSSVIDTKLEHIEYAEWVGNTLISLGKKGEKKMVSIYTPQTENYRLIDIGWTDFTEVRILPIDGNLFIKTKNAILFIYNDSHQVEWIVNGHILAFSRYGAIYETNGEIWQALWDEITNS